MSIISLQPSGGSAKAATIVLETLTYLEKTPATKYSPEKFQDFSEKLDDLKVDFTHSERLLILNHCPRVSRKVQQSTSCRIFLYYNLNIHKWTKPSNCTHIIPSRNILYEAGQLLIPCSYVNVGFKPFSIFLFLADGGRDPAADREQRRASQ